MKKNLIAGMLMMVLVLSPFFVTEAQATTEKDPITEQLNILSSALITVGNAVAGSTSLSDQDRLSLMTQLVAISTQIIELRKINVLRFELPSVVLLPTDTVAADENSKVTAEAAGLDKVRVAYDIQTNKATVEVKYLNSTKNTRTVYEFVDLKSAPAFTTKMTLLKELVAGKVSNDAMIKVSDVKNKIFVSGRDPIRDTVIVPGSFTAETLATNFGQYSVVNRVEVYPGMNVGIIRIMTDQDEWMDLVLQNDRNSSGSFVSSYNYSYAFYFPSPSEPKVGPDGEEIIPTPKLVQRIAEASESDIKNAVVSMFDSVPFTSRVPNFGSKAVAFLTKNPTTFFTSGVPGESRDCYSGTDKLIMTEFVKYLVSNIGAQYEKPEDIIKFMAPVSIDSHAHGCNSSVSFF